MLSLLQNKKSFDDPWIGRPALVKAGSHLARIGAAKAALGTRRMMLGLFTRSLSREHKAFFNANGYLTLSNFLDDETFGRLRTEVHRAIEDAAARFPLTAGTRPGYQERTLRPFGFDRYDGGTLNRFIPIREKAELLPECNAFVHHPLLNAINRHMIGQPQNENYVWIYQILQGPESDGLNDPQKLFHRDTFFSALKFWYFIDPVAAEDGPFEYVAGSHKLDRARARWEQRRALMALDRRLAPTQSCWEFSRGGSFRANISELEAMGLPAPTPLTVDANTFVIADTFGFHRRGDAQAGRTRLSLYGNNRPWAFLPVGY